MKETITECLGEPILNEETVNDSLLKEGEEIKVYSAFGMTEHIVRIGKHLGSGHSRDVYLNLDDPETVIKHEPNPMATNFSNVKEWTIWTELKQDEERSIYFCPCGAISQDGRFMLMKRAQPIPDIITATVLPKDINDINRKNIGVYHGRIVLIDYAFYVLPENYLGEVELVSFKHYDLKVKNVFD